jgi:hypothetical protein
MHVPLLNCCGHGQCHHTATLLPHLFLHSRLCHCWPTGHHDSLHSKTAPILVRTICVNSDLSLITPICSRRAGGAINVVASPLHCSVTTEYCGMSCPCHTHCLPLTMSPFVVGGWAVPYHLRLLSCSPSACANVVEVARLPPSSPSMSIM